uniref:Uncharacterized protein n=1 Tax=Romanomermis culicivorax TaxID=13658 RepID=A0A915KGF8_ROMCU
MTLLHSHVFYHQLDEPKKTDEQHLMSQTSNDARYNKRAATGGSCRGHFDRKSTYDIFAVVRLAVICLLTVAIFGVVLFLTK